MFPYLPFTLSLRFKDWNFVIAKQSSKIEGTVCPYLVVDSPIAKSEELKCLQMKDAKHIFNCAQACSEAMIVDRILVRVLPALMKHDQRLTADGIKAANEILVPDDLYAYIKHVAEDLVGHKCTDSSGVNNGSVWYS